MSVLGDLVKEVAVALRNKAEAERESLRLWKEASEAAQRDRAAGEALENARLNLLAYAESVGDVGEEQPQ